ncbi:MAG: hypothetical protein KGZ68_12245 [Dechloromonas sp.]|nr:hypothetical protein [Dechloromonas sp.]
MLVNGFNERTATSLSVSGGVATVTLPSGHGFEVDSVVLVSGATPSALNGEKRVLTTAATTITFSAAGVSDGAATGTILVRYAPLGWTKAFSAATGAVYRSSDVTSTQMFLSVTDSEGSSNAQVSGFESATGLGTGSGVFAASGVRWGRSANTPFILVGDSKTFYLLIQHVNSGNLASGVVFGFGDFVSFSTLDPYRCFIAGQTTTNLTTPSVGGSGNEGTLELSNSSTAYGTLQAPRSRSGVGGAVALIKALESYNGSTSIVVSGGTTNPGGTAFATYPAPANQGLILSRVILAEGGGPRGYLRGFYHTPQNAHASFNQMDRVQGQGQFAGRKLMALKCGSPAGTTSQGVVFVDITGPWES